MLVTTGAGPSDANVITFDVGPPGLVTLTFTLPAAGSVTVPVSVVGLLAVGVTSARPTLICAPLAKLLPVTVIVCVVPADAVTGETPETTGVEPVAGPTI